jgi:hypothetical protein
MAVELFVVGDGVSADDAVTVTGLILGAQGGWAGRQAVGTTTVQDS